VESTHPLGNDVRLAWSLDFPGAMRVAVKIDSRSRILVDDQDGLVIATGPEASATIVFRAENKPLPEQVVVDGNRVFIELQSFAGYGLWGFRATLEPIEV
jgi:hypothetical protein